MKAWGLTTLFFLVGFFASCLCTTPEAIVYGNTTDPLEIVSIKWDYVERPFLVTSFIVFTAVFMIVYHHTGPLKNWIPETCVLLVIGIGFAAIFKATSSLTDFRLGEQDFMLYLLPAIVADAAYQLSSRAFIDNVGTILLYAVVGTIINFFFIGGCLYGLSLVGAMGGLVFTPIDTFLYASIIVAVDPVAVIAIFKSVGVNDQLYFMVFGESLFNDAVTIVVFDLMAAFTFADSIKGSDMALAVGAFFVHSCGAAVVGLVVAILTGFATKFTKHMPVVQPVIVYMGGYFGYLICELLGWSGIIGLAVCCIIQTQLCFQNLSPNSYITLTTGAEVIGTIVETYVFFLMGAEGLVVKQEWNVAFIFWVIGLCLIGRIITVGGLNALANPFRSVKIGFAEQFIMWWAGLRGALAFALTTTINEYYRYRQLFITTTLMTIVFTVFLMGIPMRPLVKAFGIKMKDDIVIDTMEVISDETASQNGGKGEGSIQASEQSKRNKLSQLMYKAGYKMQKSLSSSQLAASDVKIAPSVSTFGDTTFGNTTHSTIHEEAPYVIELNSTQPSEQTIDEKSNTSEIMDYKL